MLSFAAIVLNVKKYVENKTLSQKQKSCYSPNRQAAKESIFASFKGSMSLEASLVIPIFLLFLVTIMLSIEMVRLQTNVFEALHQGISISISECRTENEESVIWEYLSSCKRPYLCLKGRERGLNIIENSDIADSGMVSITANYQMQPFVKIWPVNNMEITDRVYGHAFLGFEKDSGFLDEEETEYVYITKSGKKYHKSYDCSYIKIVSQRVDISYLEKARNSKGGKYYPCELCHPSNLNNAYITFEGDRYHSGQDCSALKRSVSIIVLKKAVENGYTPCSKCG